MEGGLVRLTGSIVALFAVLALVCFATTGSAQGEGVPLEGSVQPPSRRPSAPRTRKHKNPADNGLYVAYCPATAAASLVPKATAALANHSGWPAEECLKMDKGTYGRSHTLIGAKSVHNWLLGGYGNDTVWAGSKGDVIWGDYQPSGQSGSEQDRLHGGAGPDWIYSSHGHNEIWTGAGNDHLALIYGSGTIHCNGAGLKTLVMRALASNRHWALIGCNHDKIDPYKA
jgi:hypothetical protein